MPADDRDPKFERALARELRAGSGQAGCPDAETLAAYHDRSLTLEEMAHWKQHISGCAMCQETLSLVEVTEKQLAEDWEGERVPVLEATGMTMLAPRSRAARSADAAEESLKSAAPVTMVQSRRPKLIRWAIPLGAVAAGILVWIGIHEQRMLNSTAPASVQVAENRQQAAPEESNYGTTAKAEPQATRDGGTAVLDQEAARGGAAPAEKDLGNAKLTAPAVISDALKKDAYAAKKQLHVEPKVAAVPSPGIPPPPPASAKEEVPPSVTETVEVTSPAPPVASVQQPSAAPAGAVTGGAVDQKYAAANKSKSALQQQSTDASTNSMMLSQGVRSRAIQNLPALPGVILTPDNKVWWKLGSDGTVQLTTDAGNTWKTLNTGASSPLTAGSAPSSKVCWIAGKDGTLLLTKDRGAHWSKLTTPIAGDLGGVHAADAKHATIWDASKQQSFETQDAGASWKQVANE